MISEVGHGDAHGPAELAHLGDDLVGKEPPWKVYDRRQLWEDRCGTNLPR